MKYTPINLIGGYYADESRPWSVQDTQNWLPVLAEQDGTRTPTMLRTPPGLKPFCAIGVNDGDFTLAGPVRGTYNAEGRFFAVAGNTLFQITTAGISIPLGTIPGNSRVSFSHNQIANGNEILIVNGNSGYIYNTVTTVFQRITDTGFPGSSVALFLDNYFIGIEPRGRYAFNSDLADGLNYNALDRFTSEVSPDLIVTGVVSNNELLLLSSTTGEFFENTGATQQPFRSKRITMQKGAAGPYVAAVMDNTVFWLADDGVFYRLNGYTPERISTKPIEQAIRGLNWRQAFAFVWEDSGHAVCYWTFPDGRTWGYDAANGVWHRRQSQDLTKWRINSLTFWQQKWYAGDFQRGHLWELDWDYVLEGEEEIERERVTQVVHDNQNLAIINRLELIMDTGQPLTEPVPFEDQPEGPSITGNAPDGNVGNPWGPYSYTVTGGTPPYVVTLRPGGSLPAGIGPLSGSGTIDAGDPTTPGTQTFTVRARDANGLFDDLEDSITISVPWYATDGSGGEYMMALSNGGDWDLPYQTTPPLVIPQYRYVVSYNEEILLVETATSAAYRPSFGADWQSVSLPNLETLNVAFRGADSYIIGGNNGRILYSTSGTSFTAITVPVSGDDGTSNFYGIASNGEIIVAVQSHYSVSEDQGATWSPMSNATFVIGNAVQMRSVDCDGETFLAAGDTNRMATWTGTGAWVEQDSPFAGTAIITAVAFTEGPDGPIWVIGNEDGEIAVGPTPTSLEVSDYVFGSAVTAIHGANGRIVIGGLLGLMAATTDGETWTDLANPSTSTIFDITSVVTS